jgi:hypothetical protein
MCLDAHGVQVATPLSRKAIHNALKGASKPARKAADAACDQYEAGILNLHKQKQLQPQSWGSPPPSASYDGRPLRPL